MGSIINLFSLVNENHTIRMTQNCVSKFADVLKLGASAKYNKYSARSKYKFMSPLSICKDLTLNRHRHEMLVLNIDLLINNVRNLQVEKYECTEILMYPVKE